MELSNEMLIKILQGQTIKIEFPALTVSPKELLELRAYQALKKIKAIIEDDSLEDITCFDKIEKIVCLFEEIADGAGTRHDF